MSLWPLKASRQNWVPDAECKWEKLSATLSYPFNGLGNQKTWDFWITRAYNSLFQTRANWTTLNLKLQFTAARLDTTCLHAQKSTLFSLPTQNSITRSWSLMGSTTHHTTSKVLWGGLHSWGYLCRGTYLHHPGVVTALPPLEATRGGATPGAGQSLPASTNLSLRPPFLWKGSRGSWTIITERN